MLTKRKRVPIIWECSPFYFLPDDLGKVEKKGSELMGIIFGGRGLERADRTL